MKTANAKQPARPVALTAVAVRVTCQDCNADLRSPNGSTTWSAEDYAAEVAARRGRCSCQSCGRPLRLDRTFLALLLDPKTKGADQC